MRKRTIVITFPLLATIVCGLPARTAQAGPLIDWLFHHKRAAAVPAYPVGAPYPVATGYAPYAVGYVPTAIPTAVVPAVPYTAGYVPIAGRVAPYASGYSPYGVAYSPYAANYARPVAPTYGTYYGAASPIVGAAGNAYMTQRPVNEVITTAPAVMPSNAMPSTAPITLVPDYQSTAVRTPVTYYRPIMTTDPTTGAQVVTLAPCSSYEYQTQRVPTMGLTQLYNGGATLPAIGAVPPPVSPTYTLPRGGVPLAGPVPSTQPYATAYGTYSTPATSTIVPAAPSSGSVITPASPYSSGYSGYASNYGNYSTLQPPVSGPIGTYPTAPYGSGSTGSSAYYGSSSSTGGSNGTYLAPGQSTGSAPYSVSPYATGPYATPPQGSSTIAPSLPPIQYGAAPGSYVYPPQPGSVTPSYPQSTVPNNDPANTQPVLPLPLQSSARLDTKPQLQNIVQQPMPTNRAFTATPSAPPASGPQTNSAVPGLLPIPVPEDFKHQPRWNPGLLKEQDHTAAKGAQAASLDRTASPTTDPSITWGSKPIRWASFKEPVAATSSSQPSGAQMNAGSQLEFSAPASRLRDKRSTVAEELASERLRPILSPAQQPQDVQRPVKMVPLPPAVASSAEKTIDVNRLELSASQPASSQPINQGRYRTDGWQAAQ